MERIYIGMGSNLADPAEQLRSAVDALGQLPQTALVGVSAFYQSDSLLPGQPRYTNAVAALDSALAPLDLLDALQAQGIEVLSECQRGECGLCVLDVLALDGEIEHRDVFLSPSDKAANRHICSCVSRVRGHITIDSAYRADRLPARLPA